MGSPRSGGQSFQLSPPGIHCAVECFLGKHVIMNPEKLQYLILGEKC